jgi:hypothetical protein
MAKKQPSKPDTVITITLPGEGGIQRTGTMIVKRGGLAQIRTFNYCNIADIALALDQGTEGLIAVEAAPPPVIATKPGDEYKVRRQQFSPGMFVRTADGHEGEILAGEHDEDVFPVDVGESQVGYYRVEDLTLAQRSTTTGIDPLTIKGQQPLPTTRPATDISPMGDKSEQLALF